jgi:hypothetical protein
MEKILDEFRINSRNAINGVGMPHQMRRALARTIDFASFVYPG